MVRYIIITAYVLALCLGVIGTTALFVSSRSKNSSEGLNKALKVFLSLLLLMCVYDMAIYFLNYIISSFNGAPVLRIGDCIIALMIYSWIEVSDKYVDNNSYKVVNHFSKYYCLTYSAIWLLITVFFKDGQIYMFRWFLLVSDILLIIVLLVGSVTYIGEAIWSHQDNKKIIYLVSVTGLMAWNYIAYFWGETSVYWGNSGFIREPLDLTIFFWLGINILNIALIFNSIRKYSQVEETEVVKVFNLDESLEEVAIRFDLTNREKELVRLVYEGNSNSDIAEKLFISESTVKTHLYNIFRKMGAKNRIEVSCIVRGEK